MVVLKRQLALDCINFALIATVYEIVQWQREARERERIQAELSTRLAAAELGLLRMQLQPHFLFNALNTGVEPDGSGQREGAFVPS